MSSTSDFQYLRLSWVKDIVVVEIISKAAAIASFDTT